MFFPARARSRHQGLRLYGCGEELFNTAHLVATLAHLEACRPHGPFVNRDLHRMADKTQAGNLVETAVRARDEIGTTVVDVSGCIRSATDGCANGG